MEQSVIDEIKEHVQSDCKQLEFNTSSTKIDTLNSPQDILLKPNLSLKTRMGKDPANTWTLATKRYWGDKPLCTIKLRSNQKLEPAEHAAIQQMFANMVTENNRALKKSKILPCLYLSYVISSNENAPSFLLVGFLKQ